MPTRPHATNDDPAPPPEPGAERPRARPSARALCALVPALLLCAVGGWEIRAAARAGEDVPGDAAWQRAAQLVRERYQPGDLIAFAPDWIDPVGRAHLGDLIPVDMAARMDGDRYARLWELSIRGATSADSRGRQVASSQVVGGVRVRELVRAPAEILTDFVALTAANPRALTTQGKAKERPTVRLEEVGFSPHRCVRVTPAPGETVRMAYKDVRLGTSLVGYVGLADVFTRREVRDPGRLQVFVDGHEVAARAFGVDDGWVRFAAATGASEGAEVVFAATAVGPGARDRLICFAAEARK